MRRRIARLSIVLLLAAGMGVAVAASPQPTPVCSACGKPFQEAAGGGIVERSDVLVQVHRDGSATWTVRNELARGAEELREDPERLDEAARTAARSGEGPSEGLRVVEARMDDDTAVLVFEDEAAARSHAGLLVAQYFHERGHVYRYHLNAHAFTFRAPPGSIVTNDPPGAAVDGRNATFQGGTHERLGAGEPLDDDAYVVFGPDDSTVTDVRTTAAVAEATSPIVVRTFSRFALLQSATFAGVLLVVVRLVRGYGDALGVREFAAAGLLAAACLAAAHGVLGFGSATAPSAVVVAIVALAASPRARGLVATPGRQAAAALVALGVGFLVAVSVAPTRGDGSALDLAAVALPFCFAFPLGGALADGSRRRHLTWAGLVVAGFAVAVVTVVGPADPPQGLAGGVTAMVAFGAALVVPVLVAPLAGVGHALARGVRSP